MHWYYHTETASREVMANLSSHQGSVLFRLWPSVCKQHNISSKLHKYWKQWNLTCVAPNAFNTDHSAAAASFHIPKLSLFLWSRMLLWFTTEHRLPCYLLFLTKPLLFTARQVYRQFRMDFCPVGGVVQKPHSSQIGLGSSVTSRLFSVGTLVRTNTAKSVCSQDDMTTTQGPILFT